MKEDCPECGTQIEIEKTTNLIHYAEKNCPNCSFHEWKKKPSKKEERTKTSNYETEDVFKFHNQNQKRCFFCRRNRDELGNNQTFTLDHIEELSNGGKDTVRNLQVLCTACHRLKNWMRLYNNWHFNGKPNGE